MDKVSTYFKNNNIVTFIAILFVVVCLPCLAAAEGSDLGNTNTGGWNPNAAANLIPTAPTTADAGECFSYKKGSKLQNKCPSGRRYDISACCIAKQNGTVTDCDDTKVNVVNKQESSSCLNTMPVKGYVDRVPEDICYRSEGTSNNSDARNHNGVDYAAKTGDEVVAAADGWVVRSEYVANGGGTIGMHHPRYGGNGASVPLKNKEDYYVTQYLHLSERIYKEPLCPPGTKMNDSCWIKRGTVIGRVGATGCGDCGSHLHFEMKDSNNNYIDPMCDNIQGLCGGQAVNLTSCRKGCEGREEECKASMASLDYQGPNAVTGTGGGKSDDSGNFANVHSKDIQCELESYRNDLKRCFFCTPFMILFNTASEIADNSFNTFAPWVMNVVIVAMALWMALKVLLFVSAMEVKDPRVLIKELLTQSFIVLFVVVILDTELKTFMSIAIEPIFNTGFKLAQYVMNNIECTNDYGITENGGLPASMGNDIVCTIKSIQDYIVDIMALGSQLICVAWFQESWKGIPLFLHWGYFLSGIGIWIAALLLLIVYPFLLIDVMLQLCIAVALMPAAIGCYAFKITRKYVGNIFETIMNAMFTFVFLAIIIFMVTAQLNESLKDLVDPLREATGVSSVNLWQRVMWSGEMFLRVLFISLLGVAVMDSTKDFTGTFSKGGISIKPIGSPVGGMAASAGKALAKGVGKTAINIARPHALKLGGNIKFGLQKFKNDYWESKINSRGGEIKRKSWFRRRDITRTVEYENGKRVIVKNQVTAVKGKQIQTRNDGWIKRTIVTSPGGNVQETSELIKGGKGQLVNKNGTINRKYANQIKGNTAHGDLKAEEAILRAELKELMPGIHAAKMLDKAYKPGTRTSEYNGNGDFQVTQDYADGTRVVITKTEMGKRDMIRVKTISKNGEVEEYATNGMLNMVATYKGDRDGNWIGGDTPKCAFSATKYYRERDGVAPITRKGKVRKDFLAYRVGYTDMEGDICDNQFTRGGGNINIPGFS